MTEAGRIDRGHDARLAPRASVRATVGLTVGQYAASGLGVLASLVAARSLGASEYGVAVLAMSYPSLLLSLSSLKSTSVATRFLAVFAARGERARLLAAAKLGYVVDVAVFVLAFALIWLTAGTAGFVLGGPERLPELMFWYAASFPLLGLRGTSYAALAAGGAFGTLGILHAVDSGLRLIAIVCAVAIRASAESVVVATALAQAGAALVSLIIGSRALRRLGNGVWWRARLGEVGDLLREIRSFYVANYLATTLSGALREAPVLILGYFGGPREAGQLRLAFSLAGLARLVGGAAGRVSYPRIAAFWARGMPPPVIARTLLGWSAGLGLLNTLLMLVAAAAFPLLVRFALGPQHAVVAEVAWLLLVGGLAGSIFFWLPGYYYGTGEVGRWTRWSGLHVALALALGSALALGWGVHGMALGLGLAEALFLSLMALRAIGVLPAVRCTPHAAPEPRP